MEPERRQHVEHGPREFKVARTKERRALHVGSACRIDNELHEDLAFRVLAANQTPDHVTIARFRARHERAISELFSGVLSLCARAGLVKVGIVAIDAHLDAPGETVEDAPLHRLADRLGSGPGIRALVTGPAPALYMNGLKCDYERIAREILEEAKAIDAAEDELYGEARGDELPAGLRTAGDRCKWLREARQALEAERAAKAKKIPRDRSERLSECKARLEQDWRLERRVVAEHAVWHARGIASDTVRGSTRRA